MKIKICGLHHFEDIDYVNQCLPDYAGFIIDYPKSHRSIEARSVFALKQKLDTRIQGVGVFVNAPIQGIIELCQKGAIDVIQLHGNEDNAYIEALQGETGKKVIKAFVVEENFVIEEAQNCVADWILLDGGRGSGKTFSYNKIKAIKRPYFLAGGITPENMEQIILHMRPYGVDLSSGVETEQMKDINKIERAMLVARGIRI